MLFESCTTSTNTKSLTNEVKIDTLDDSGGPPFRNNCLCSFQNFGSYKISNDNYNIYYSGKGWNPNLHSCSWAWGEDVYNEIPNDTNVTVLKIHLLDLDNFSLPTNKTEYGNDTIKKYVIAIFTHNIKKGKDTCFSIFDPYKTGKYKNPIQ